MSSLGQNRLRSETTGPVQWRGEYYPPPSYWQRSDRSLWPLLAGLAVVGLGVLAWRYVGPDLRRYLKTTST